MVNSRYFTGDKNILKRSVISDSINMAAPSSLGSWFTYVSTQSIVHNLGYIPMVRIYFENDASDGKIYPAGGRRLSGAYPGLAANSIFCLWELTTTTLTIYLESNTAKAGTRNVYYNIYLDS